jgi:predicted nucleic acid-binding protein
MIVLDTNVVSELMKPSPAPAVVSWLNRQMTTTIFLTTITLGEIGYGLHNLPPGKRRSFLEQALERVISLAFEDRILSFGIEAARIYGEVMGQRQEMGRPWSILDGQIASIARASGFAVATRNVRDFSDCGIEVFNPFEPGP